MATKEQPPIRVILADDHEILRDGFRIMLKKQTDIKLVGEAENGAHLMQQVANLSPDVIITDIKMPIMDGIDATKRLHKKYPGLGIIAFSMYDEDSLIIEMLEAGAKGYLLKNASRKEVFEAITTVHRKETYYCHHTTVKLAQMIGKSNFTPDKSIFKNDFNLRELEIINFICDALSNKEIGAALSLSVRTVEDYRGKIQLKMGVKNTAGIVVYAIKNGLYKL